MLIVRIDLWFNEIDNIQFHWHLVLVMCIYQNEPVIYKDINNSISFDINLISVDC